MVTLCSVFQMAFRFQMLFHSEQNGGHYIGITNHSKTNHWKSELQNVWYSNVFGIEYRTNPVFKVWKQVQFVNGAIYDWHSKSEYFVQIWDIY